ncbi:hypothetical protein GJ744_002239 [Endocarpon pusillum]|uniref:Heterokaryon incompatibility domain-containing protein n=1 Tax=Endocarpon pusillum TaxID=364733 RepID=A0A8H7A858_9EURO|nr:hypothetical protein GJ744_002239 [Endocarpon pusillum]
MAFLDPNRISHRMLLVSQDCRDDYGQSTEDVVRADIEELWKSALCDIDRTGAYSRLHPSAVSWIQMNMTDEAWNEALVRASHSLRRQWPSDGKLRNVINGFWPEFTQLHSHMQHMAHACYRGNRKIRDANDQLKQLLLIHSWLNARHGNSGEDQELMHLMHALISTPTGKAQKMQRKVVMPRRCVWIGLNPSVSVIRVVDTERVHQPYLAVSYTWDTDMPELKLTRSNLTAFQNGIPISTVPKVFRDAITLARALGFGWLWIDRWCIIQDNIDECSTEVLSMSRYFLDAALIMSALPTPSLMSTFNTWGCKVMAYEPYSFWAGGSIEDRGWTIQEAHLINSRHPTLALDWITVSRLVEILAGGSTDPSRAGSEHTKGGTEDIIVCKDDVSAASNSRESEQIERARRSLQDGCTSLCEGSPTRASATLTFCRDLVAQLVTQSTQALEIYTMATALLGACYHLLDLDEMASDILTLLYEQHYRQPSHQVEPMPYAHARLLCALGVTSLRLGNNDAAQKHLCGARQTFSVPESEAEKLFLICVDISLSDVCKAEGNVKEANRLLDAALEQLTDLPVSPTVDAHMCRALHRKSLLHEVEGNKIRYRASQAGAVAAYEQLKADGFRAARNVTRPADLTQADFDALVEPWFV